MAKASGGWADDGHCYVCGAHNPEGMRLEFAMSDGEIETCFTAQKRHQGYMNILHGGILSMVMDEVMVLLPYRKFRKVFVSVELNVQLKRPVYVGETVRVRARFEGDQEAGQRLYRMAADAQLADGTVVALAKAKCMRVAGELAGEPA